MSKPEITVKMRVSVDSSQKQRYTEQEILAELTNDNIKIERRLMIRKSDGAVMGELLGTGKPSKVKVMVDYELGDWVPRNSIRIRRYHNFFEGWAENGFNIIGLNGDKILCDFQEKFVNDHVHHREEWIPYYQFYQTTEQHCNKYRLMPETSTLDIIANQIFFQFISWYGPVYKGNCTNMYRMIDDVIDDWNDFCNASNLEKHHRTHIVKILEQFSTELVDKMPRDLFKRIGTNKILYKRVKTK